MFEFYTFLLTIPKDTSWRIPLVLMIIDQWCLCPLFLCAHLLWYCSKIQLREHPKKKSINVFEIPDSPPIRKNKWPIDNPQPKNKSQFCNYVVPVNHSPRSWMSFFQLRCSKKILALPIWWYLINKGCLLTLLD